MLGLTGEVLKEINFIKDFVNGDMWIFREGGQNITDMAILQACRLKM